MTSLTFPFNSATAEEHLKALHDYYPYPVSANNNDGEPEDYCVGGGLCRYLLGEITNWEVDAVLDEVQDIIYRSNRPEDNRDMYDIRFPENTIVAEALSYIANQYHTGYVELLLKQEIENNPYHDYVGGFWRWLATNLIESNDEDEDFKQAWFYCAIPFYKFELQYATWDYLEYLEEHNLTITS